MQPFAYIILSRFLLSSTRHPALKVKGDLRSTSDGFPNHVVIKPSTSNSMTSPSNPSSAKPTSKAEPKSSGKHGNDARLCDTSPSSHVHSDSHTVEPNTVDPRAVNPDIIPSSSIIALDCPLDASYSLTHYLASDAAQQDFIPFHAETHMSASDTVRTHTVSMKLVLDDFDAAFYKD
jgi:hypothetical protein